MVGSLLDVMPKDCPSMSFHRPNDGPLKTHSLSPPLASAKQLERTNLCTYNRSHLNQCWHCLTYSIVYYDNVWWPMLWFSKIRAKSCCRLWKARSQERRGIIKPWVAQTILCIARYILTPVLPLYSQHDLILMCLLLSFVVFWVYFCRPL